MKSIQKEEKKQLKEKLSLRPEMKLQCAEVETYCESRKKELWCIIALVSISAMIGCMYHGEKTPQEEMLRKGDSLITVSQDCLDKVSNIANDTKTRMLWYKERENKLYDYCQKFNVDVIHGAEVYYGEFKREL